LIYWGRGVLIEDEQERGEKLEAEGKMSKFKIQMTNEKKKIQISNN